MSHQHDDLAAALGRCSGPELQGLHEHTVNGAASRHPGSAGVFAALWSAIDAEMTRRAVRRLRDDAMFQVLVAELRVIPADPVGDISGLPSWKELSGPPDVGPGAVDDREFPVRAGYTPHRAAAPRLPITGGAAAPGVTP